MLLSKLLFIAMLLAIFASVSCESEQLKDGDWEPIQITINGKRCSSSTFKVSANGGEYRIFSKNYGSLWTNAIMENDKVVWPSDHDWSDFKNIHLTNDWYEVQYDKAGNILVNILAKKNDTPSRSVTFDVECGDAFGVITLLQE